MADKVIGGTPVGAHSLCSTCRLALKVTGLNLQAVTYCHGLPRAPVVEFPVAQCSIYDDKRLPSLDQMRDIAWEVKSRTRGQVGFAPDPQRMEIVITPPSRGNPAVPDMGVGTSSKPSSS